MSTKLRKALSIVLVLITVLCIAPIHNKADAADSSVSWPSFGEKKYCMFTPENGFTTYSKAVCEAQYKFETLTLAQAQAADCRIYGITINTKNHAKSSVKVSYIRPSTKKRVTRFVKFSELFTNKYPKSSANTNIKANYEKAYTYLTFNKAVDNSSSGRGYLEGPYPNQDKLYGDKIYTLYSKKASNGTSYTKIIYEAKNGDRAYKLAWVKTSDLNKVSKKLSITDVAEYMIGQGNPTGYSTDWCARFVKWCAKAVGCTDSNYPMGTVYCPTLVEKFVARKQWVERGKKTPQPGWIIFLDWNVDGDANHVAIVTKVVGSEVYYIDGNSDGPKAVKSHHRALTDVVILGYGTPNY